VVKGAGKSEVAEKPEHMWFTAKKVYVVVWTCSESAGNEGGQNLGWLGEFRTRASLVIKGRDCIRGRGSGSHVNALLSQSQPLGYSNARPGSTTDVGVNKGLFKLEIAG